MSRIKKKRSFVRQYLPAEKQPSKAELLVDDESYESRKKRALEKKKKHKSVYEKEREKQLAEQAEPVKSASRGGRLADKIKALNAKNAKQEKTSDE